MQTEVTRQRSGVTIPERSAAFCAGTERVALDIVAFRFPCLRLSFDRRWFSPSLILRRLLLLLVPILSISSSVAQTITLQTGQKVETQGVRRDGDIIMGKVQVGGGSGEVGYHVAQIMNVNFPEPRALKTASELLIQGQTDKALAEIDPVVAYYSPFKDVPGNWWAQAALIKVSVLAAQQHGPEAEALAGEIARTAKDGDMARAAQLRVVTALVRNGELEKALSVCDAAIKNSNDPTTLATAWIAKGDALLAQKSWDEALLAYLHVPVFYPDEKIFLPAALLGSGRVYRRLNDVGRARKSLNELVSTFPQSAEAGLAQAELKKL
jgi:tetratricopeptide (TPR) repeat protein